MQLLHLVNFHHHPTAKCNCGICPSAASISDPGHRAKGPPNNNAIDVICGTGENQCWIARNIQPRQTRRFRSEKSLNWILTEPFLSHTHHRFSFSGIIWSVLLKYLWSCKTESSFSLGLSTQWIKFNAILYRGQKETKYLPDFFSTCNFNRERYRTETFAEGWWSYCIK